MRTLPSFTGNILRIRPRGQVGTPYVTIAYSIPARAQSIPYALRLLTCLHGAFRWHSSNQGEVRRQHFLIAQVLTN